MLPTVMVAAARTHISGRTTSPRSAKAMNTSWSSATKPAALEATARKAVMGVGAPWYTSGAHVWNGTAETLNAKPMTTKTMAREIGRASWRDRVGQYV